MAEMTEYTSVHALLEGVADDGSRKVFAEDFVISANHPDEVAVRMAKAPVGGWKLAPSGDAYLICELLSVTRSQRNVIGGSYNPRTIYEKD